MRRANCVCVCVCGTSDVLDLARHCKLRNNVTIIACMRICAKRETVRGTLQCEPTAGATACLAAQYGAWLRMQLHGIERAHNSPPAASAEFLLTNVDERLTGRREITVRFFGFAGLLIGSSALTLATPAPATPTHTHATCSARNRTIIIFSQAARRLPKTIVTCSHQQPA